MDIYEMIKEQLSVLDAARYYGLKINRSGYISCLFHDERTPSMKLYEHNYHCYGCGEHGDVIGLASVLFNLLPYEAAQKLSRDFRINVDEHDKYRSSVLKKVSDNSYMVRENRAFCLLSDYCDYLENCKIKYAPKNHDEELHPLFVKSLTDLEKFKYYRDFMTESGREERKRFVSDFTQEFEKINKILHQKEERKLTYEQINA